MMLLLGSPGLLPDNRRIARAPPDEEDERLMIDR
jgi:hypothetical protein